MRWKRAAATIAAARRAMKMTARDVRDADVVVLVPHPRRASARFNQAEDLAQHLGVPVIPLLKRVVFTPKSSCRKEERHRNVKDAFAFADPRSLIPDPSIVVLVDDVSTTGATLDACARVLKSAGVKEVRALTAARVVNERR
jgi:predicted amidophosphoribosyltransferase